MPILIIYISQFFCCYEKIFERNNLVEKVSIFVLESAFSMHYGAEEWQHEAAHTIAAKKQKGIMAMPRGSTIFSFCFGGYSSLENCVTQGHTDIFAYPLRKHAYL